MMRNTNDKIIKKSGVKDTLYKKIVKGKNSFVLFCLAFAVLLSLLFTPLFNINHIIVSGEEKISKEDLINASGIIKGVNILKADLRKASLNISKLPYVDSVTLKRQFPDTVEIVVQESVVKAYISFINKYIGIKEDARVVNIYPGDEEVNLPVFLGVNLDKFEYGQAIETKDEDVLNIIREYILEIENNNLVEEIKTIDLSDINNVQLKLSSETVVHMGGRERLSYKVAYLEKVISGSEIGRGGVLDVSSADGSAIYKAGGSSDFNHKPGDDLEETEE